jgi:type IV pilus assembly protein PilM
LHINSLDLEQVDLAAWFASVQSDFEPEKRPAPPAADQKAAEGQPAAGDVAATPVEATDAAPTTPAGPTGIGYVFELQGYHFHNSLPDTKAYTAADDGGEERQFVLATFCKNLQIGTVQLPDGENGELIDVPISALGIGYPVIITKNPMREYTYSAVPESEGTSSGGRALSSGREFSGRETAAFGAADKGPEAPETWKLKRYDFTIQFAWTQTPRTKRKEAMAKQAAQVSAAAEQTQ